MKLLFVDHAFHRKTASADFFTDRLRADFAVDVHYYERAYDTRAASAAAGCDGVVVWEFPVARNRFFFPGKRNVFVPMYDNEWASRWQWKRIAWSGMGVVSFCGAVSAHARRCGVSNLLDVRYFPDPAAFPQEPGDPKRVFLWERGEITRTVAETLFPPSEGYVFDVKGAREFLERDAYLARIARCGVVIAPRRKEGIGLAFLEAMAMGKCVVAHDDATMNEYLVDGETGILFDADRPRPVSAAAVARVRAAMPAAVRAWRARWCEDAAKINPFIAAQPVCRPDFAARVKLALSYPIYLAEGALFRLRQSLWK